MPGGGAQYPTHPPGGPALGFDSLASQPSMGAPGYPMPTPGGAAMYPGMSSQMPPGMSSHMPPGMPSHMPSAMPSGMPMPGMPPPPSSGGLYGAAMPSMPQPGGGYPAGNLSFGGAAMATASFPSQYRSQVGPPQPQPHFPW
ncbi:hypothetical protein OS493_017132 [Desmophyllum pertusum]|uniref:Uncharacterized protein n=1 Tax=Desmophyllum pertusum TaxID=174260 RepID=A0A9W9YC98_9CNID|nr:hypothetical protein OS493_017132 [Desmophyllum pertusum]